MDQLEEKGNGFLAAPSRPPGTVKLS
jgi:hypothetical protein